ncbi:hypothetical protein IWX91DRAFT_364410 [Phyllosticta citricarpa]
MPRTPQASFPNQQVFQSRFFPREGHLESASTWQWCVCANADPTKHHLFPAWMMFSIKLRRHRRQPCRLETRSLPLHPYNDPQRQSFQTSHQRQTRQSPSPQLSRSNQSQSSVNDAASNSNHCGLERQIKEARDIELLVTRCHVFEERSLQLEKLLERTKSKAVNRCMELEKQLTSTREAHDQLSRQSLEMRQSAEKRYVELEKNYNAMREANGLLCKHLSTTRKSISNLQSQQGPASKNAYTEDASVHVAEVESTSRILTERSRDLETLAAASKNEIFNLRSQLAAFESKEQMLQARVAALTTEVECLRGRNQKLEDKKWRLQWRMAKDEKQQDVAMMLVGPVLEEIAGDTNARAESKPSKASNLKVKKKKKKLTAGDEAKQGEGPESPVTPPGNT